VNIWGTMAGAFVGTLVLTTVLRAATEFKLTRMDLPFLLGTVVTVNRGRAKAIGYLMHFLNGQLFGLGYYAVFAAIHEANVWLGAILGLLHGLVAGTTIVNVLLPVLHPRMGTPTTSAPAVAMLEPPGFLLLNYGIGTPAVTVLAHVAYGAIIGAFTAAAS
jgi:hypothetical protein